MNIFPDPDAWSRAISAAVVPVVMISACSLMSLAFYNRLAAIVARLRTFQRECLKSQEELYRLRQSGADAAFSARRTEALIRIHREQTSGVLRRAHLLQTTLTCMLAAVALLILSSLGLGFSAAAPGLYVAAGALFFAGGAVVFCGVIFAILEMRAALGPIREESDFVEKLLEENGTAGQ